MSVAHLGVACADGLPYIRVKRNPNSEGDMPPDPPRGAGAFPAPVTRAPTSRPDPADLYAALDLGTNSCRMLIAQPKGNQFHVIDSFSKSVQLGQGLERYGRLSRTSIGRTIQAIADLQAARSSSTRSSGCGSWPRKPAGGPRTDRTSSPR